MEDIREIIDLFSRKTAKIKKQYPTLQKWEDGCATIIYQRILEEQLITEFLYTVDPKKTISQLIKQIGPEIVDYHFVMKNGKIVSIYFKFKDELSKNLSSINKFMDKFGWYPSFIKYKNGGKYTEIISKVLSMKDVIIRYEAKYDEEYIPEGKYLYHITPDIKYPSIRHSGLTAKNQEKISNHPGRVYLIEDENPTHNGNLLEIAISLYNDYENKDRVKQMFLLRVDLSKLRKLKFFDDPLFFMGKGIWTYENIPPYALEIIDEFDMI